MLYNISPLTLKRVRITLALTCFVSLIVLAAMVRSRQSTVLRSDGQASLSQAERQAQSKQAYGALPLSFEVNRGQVDASVQYLARGSGYPIARANPAGRPRPARASSPFACAVRAISERGERAHRQRQ